MKYADKIDADGNMKRGKCTKCGFWAELDSYATCNRPGRDDSSRWPCGGACHAVRDAYGSFNGFCGPVDITAVPPDLTPELMEPL